jgi:hypothetical protein
MLNRALLQSTKGTFGHSHGILLPFLLLLLEVKNGHYEILFVVLGIRHEHLTEVRGQRSL